MYRLNHCHDVSCSYVQHIKHHWASQLLLSSSWEESGGYPNYPFSGEDAARVSKPNQTNKETFILNAAY